MTKVSLTILLPPSKWSDGVHSLRVYGGPKDGPYSLIAEIMNPNLRKNKRKSITKRDLKRINKKMLAEVR